MRVREQWSEREVGLLQLLFASGLILTLGATWWLKGFAVAALVLGLMLLFAAWSCVVKD